MSGVTSVVSTAAFIVNQNCGARPVSTSKKLRRPSLTHRTVPRFGYRQHSPQRRETPLGEAAMTNAQGEADEAARQTPRAWATGTRKEPCAPTLRHGYLDFHRRLTYLPAPKRVRPLICKRGLRSVRFSLRHRYKAVSQRLITPSASIPLELRSYPRRTLAPFRGRFRRSYSQPSRTRLTRPIGHGKRGDSDAL